MGFLAGFGPQLAQGVLVTLAVSLCAFVLGALVAITAALLERSRFRVLKWIFSGVLSLARGLPELLVIFAVYFGGSILLSHLLHHSATVSVFLAGVIALGFIFASYAVQVLRSAFSAIPTGQLAAGQALGLSSGLVFRKILLPQALRHALPGISNLWLVLLKDSALVSLIGLGDLVNKARLAAATTNEPFKFYMIAAFVFLILTTLSQWSFSRVNQRLNKSVI